MIEWQEELIKSLEKPEIMEYDDTSMSTSPSNHSTGHAESTDVALTDSVSIVRGSSSPEVTESYLPHTIQVTRGSSVVWKNDDNVIHTVTEVENNEFDSGLIQTGSQWKHIFETEGQFDYYCALHPWMKGSVVVK